MSRSVNLGPIACIADGRGREFVVDKRRVAVFRTRRGGVYATQARCPHKNGPLADGLIGERAVMCPLHGHKFDLAFGEPLGHACGNLETYPVDIDESGDIKLLVED
jgi:nitrite reductase (NADH) small subunit